MRSYSTWQTAKILATFAFEGLDIYTDIQFFRRLQDGTECGVDETVPGWIKVLSMGSTILGGVFFLLSLYCMYNREKYSKRHGFKSPYVRIGIVLSIFEDAVQIFCVYYILRFIGITPTQNKDWTFKGNLILSCGSGLARCVLACEYFRVQSGSDSSADRGSGVALDSITVGKAGSNEDGTNPFKAFFLAFKNKFYILYFSIVVVMLVIAYAAIFVFGDGFDFEIVSPSVEIRGSLNTTNWDNTFQLSTVARLDTSDISPRRLILPTTRVWDHGRNIWIDHNNRVKSDIELTLSRYGVNRGNFSGTITLLIRDGDLGTEFCPCEGTFLINGVEARDGTWTIEDHDSVIPLRLSGDCKGGPKHPELCELFSMEIPKFGVSYVGIPKGPNTREFGCTSFRWIGPSCEREVVSARTSTIANIMSCGGAIVRSTETDRAIFLHGSDDLEPSEPTMIESCYGGSGRGTVNFEANKDFNVSVYCEWEEGFKIDAVETLYRIQFHNGSGEVSVIVAFNDGRNATISLPEGHGFLVDSSNDSPISFTGLSTNVASLQVTWSNESIPFTVVPAPSSATPSPSVTPSSSQSSSSSSSSTQSRTPSKSNTPSQSRTPSETASRSSTSTETSTMTGTPTVSPSATGTVTNTPSETASNTATPTVSATSSVTTTETVTPSPSATMTATPSPSATTTVSLSVTATTSRTPSPSGEIRLHSFSNEVECQDRACPEREWTVPYEGTGVLLLTWYDNFGCSSSAKTGDRACQWEVLLNGASCTSPGPIGKTMYSKVYNEKSAMTHNRGGTLEAFCTEFHNDNVVGKVNVSVVERGSQVIGTNQATNPPELGWPNNGAGPPLTQFMVDVREVDALSVQLFSTAVVEDGTANGKLPSRVFSVNVPQTGDVLRIVWTDHHRCTPSTGGGRCDWKVRVDGVSCEVELMATVYNIDRRMHDSVSLVGYCGRLVNGNVLTGGVHEVAIWESAPAAGQHGTPIVGDTYFPGLLQVSVADSGERQYAMPVRTELLENDYGLSEPVVQFHKASDTSLVRVTYYDNYGCRCQASATTACRMEVLIDGRNCGSPGPLRHDAVAPTPSNYQSPILVAGVCDTLDNGSPILSGSHTLQIYVEGAAQPISGLDYGRSTYRRGGLREELTSPVVEVELVEPCEVKGGSC